MTKDDRFKTTLWCGFTKVIRRIVPVIAFCWVAWLEPARAAEVIRLGVLENSPPMSWRDEAGDFKGYSIDMIEAVCRELNWKCRFMPSTIGGLIDDLKQDRIDIAAVSLLATPERRAQILLARPYYTSITVWFSAPGVRPDQAGVRVAAVRGSAQARFALARNWTVVETTSNAELTNALLAGQADGMLAPMMTVLGVRDDVNIRAKDLIVYPMNEPELTGATSFGISPLRPELKPLVDGALERLERSGVYDKINSRYVPFRVN